ncbi:hypothetical protein ARSQ2_02458 [Arsenophonus endosymbiont of Bemisia tabaci Q2]|nr:hypothetical protein ARSQ2_02458 [Arsenophonus endosymbiont of Bemisia tabaci Q2]
MLIQGNSCRIRFNLISFFFFNRQSVIAKRLNFDDIIYMSYSIDFRSKVIFTMEEEGLSIRETAKQFWIGFASLSRWINQI